MAGLQFTDEALEGEDFADRDGVDPNEGAAGRPRREPEAEPLTQMEAFLAPEPELQEIGRGDHDQDGKKKGGIKKIHGFRTISETPDPFKRARFP
jgi:hypothetical protein